MNVPARVRHALARRPRLYWLAIATVALGAGVAAATAVADVEEARRAWGDEHAAVVAVRAVAPGEPLAGAVQRRALPAPMIPQGAITDVPAGAVARQHLGAGEIVVDHDVAPTAAPQALIPPGWRAVAVAEAVPTGVAVGDAVTAASGGIVLAKDGTVVAVRADSVLVAVPAAEAPTVAHAAVTGDLALLLGP